jgi:hypothetical protein
LHTADLTVKFQQQYRERCIPQTFRSSFSNQKERKREVLSSHSPIRVQGSAKKQVETAEERER